MQGLFVSRRAVCAASEEKQEASFMARRNRSSIRKERIIMLASSVFVLAALTVTGVYVRNNNRAEKEDLSLIHI